MKTRNRLLAAVLTLVMIVGMLPVSAFAVNASPATGTDIAIENMDGNEEDAAKEGGSPSDPGELPGSGEDKEQDEDKGEEGKTADSTPSPAPSPEPSKAQAETSPAPQTDEEDENAAGAAKAKDAAPALKAHPARNTKSGIDFDINFDLNTTFTYPSWEEGYPNLTSRPIEIKNKSDEIIVVTRSEPAYFDIQFEGVLGTTVNSEVKLYPKDEVYDGHQIDRTFIHIAPIPNLSEGTYKETITFTAKTSSSIVSKKLTVSFTVLPAGSTAIDFEVQNACDFPSMEVGYSQPDRKEIALQNTGTAGVRFSISGSYSNFDVVVDSNNCYPSSNRFLYCRPKSGLAAGKYTEQIAVVATHLSDSSKTVTKYLTVSFEVLSAGSGTIDFEVQNAYTFSSAEVGYSQPDRKEIALYNTGTASVKFSISGSYSTFDAEVNNSICQPSSNKFLYCRPKTGLAVGKYTEQIAVVATHASDPGKTVTKYLTVSFEVLSAGSTAIDFTLQNAHTFPPAKPGYPQPENKAIALKNTGTAAVRFSISGSYRYFDTRVNDSICQPSSNSFIYCRPKANLAAGTYTEQIAVVATDASNPDKTVTKTITLSFAVRPDLESITIKKSPNQTTYVEGDYFNSAGMEVIATYKGGFSEDVTKLVDYKKGALTTSDTAITISYTWDGTTKTASQKITVNAPQPTTYTVTVKADPSNGGTVTGGGTVEKGQSVTVEASANSDYVFDGWYDGSERKSPLASYTFKVEDDTELEARFLKATLKPTSIDLSTDSVQNYCYTDENYNASFSLIGSEVALPNQTTVTLDGKGVSYVSAIGGNLCTLNLNDKNQPLEAGWHTLEITFAGTETLAPCSKSFVFAVVDTDGGVLRANPPVLDFGEAPQGSSIGPQDVVLKFSSSEREESVFVEEFLGVSDFQAKLSYNTAGSEYDLSENDPLEFTGDEDVSIRVRPTSGLAKGDHYETLKVVYYDEDTHKEYTLTIPIRLTVYETFALRSKVTPDGAGTVIFKKGDAEVTTAREGEELTVSWEPEIGYARDDFMLKTDDGPVDLVPLETGSPVTAWSFTMPASDVTATAIFKQKQPTWIKFEEDSPYAWDAGESYVLRFGLSETGDRSKQITVTVDGIRDDDLEYNGLGNYYWMNLNETPGSLSVGDHTVKVSFAGDDDLMPCTGTFILTITTKVTGITLDSTGAKTKYFTGEELDVRGLALTAEFSDGTEKEITVTEDMVSDFDSQTPGKQTLTVTYEGFEAEYEVEVSEITVTGITLDSKNAKTKYFTGEDLNVSGLVLTAEFSDGTEKEITVTEGMVSGFDSQTPGKQTLTVTYEGSTAEYEVEVSEIIVTGITLDSKNAKTEYFTGEDLDVSGLTLTVSKSDGSKETVNVTASMVSGFDNSKPGKQTLTVSYEGFIANYKIEVKAKTNPPTPVTVTGIKLNIDSVKKIYTEGDALDVTGLTLTVSKSDGSKETVNVTASMVSGFDNSKPGKQTLTVTYKGFTATYGIEVKAKTNPPTPTYEATIRSVAWQKGSGKNLDLTFHRSEDDHLTYGLFGSLEIGGQTVGSANYGAAEGSLKLSIKPEYLETLSVGDHTVKVNFQDGSAAVKLTVLAASAQPTPSPTPKPSEKPTSPKTGDESNLALHCSLMFLSLAGLLAVAVNAKRRRKTR